MAKLALDAISGKASPKKSKGIKSESIKRILKDLEIAVCEPWYLFEGVDNNVYMQQDDSPPVDQDKAMAEFDRICKLFSMECRLYREPPEPNLQDQHYISNVAMVMHHLTEGDKRQAILAKFRAAGRPGEEKIAGPFLEAMGIKCVQSPFYWEGEAETKWIKDNLYIGGWGIWDEKTGIGRSEPKAYDWMEKQFGMKVIRVQETDPKLYHLDCSILRLDDENVVVSADTLSPKDVHNILASAS